MNGFDISMRVLFLAPLCLLGIATGSASADQLSIGASEFNTLFQVTNSSAPTSGGASQYIFAGESDDGLSRRGLIAFNVASIPAGAAVTGASVTLWFDKSKNSGPLSGSLYRMTRSWGEGTSPTGVTQGGGGGAGSPATQNDATWFDAFYNATDPDASIGWFDPGAEGNYITTASATTTIQGGQGTLTAYSWSDPGLVSDIQAWIQNPSTNFGWMLQGDESQTGTSMRFQSADSSFNGSNSTIDALPVLTVTYSAPEPAMIGIGATCGALLVLARRRRA